MVVSCKYESFFLYAFDFLMAHMTEISRREEWGAQNFLPFTHVILMSPSTVWASVASNWHLVISASVVTHQRICFSEKDKEITVLLSCVHAQRPDGKAQLSAVTQTLLNKVKQAVNKMQLFAFYQIPKTAQTPQCTNVAHFATPRIKPKSFTYKYFQAQLCDSWLAP